MPRQRLTHGDGRGDASEGRQRHVQQLRGGARSEHAAPLGVRRLHDVVQYRSERPLLARRRIHYVDGRELARHAHARHLHAREELIVDDAPLLAHHERRLAPDRLAREQRSADHERRHEVHEQALSDRADIHFRHGLESIENRRALLGGRSQRKKSRGRGVYPCARRGPGLSSVRGH